MADTSVGSVQISLDIEVSSSIEKQISNVSQNIANTLKSNIENSVKKSDLSKSIGKSLSSVASKSLDIGSKIGKNIAEGIKKATSKNTKIETNFVDLNSIKEKANKSLIGEKRNKKGISKADLESQLGSSESLYASLENDVSLLGDKLEQIAKDKLEKVNKEIKRQIDNMSNAGENQKPIFQENIDKLKD